MDYAKHYDALVERARRRRLVNRYFETHHVLPRCMGGGDEPENLVRLLPEEHYVAHQLLMKMHPKVGKLVYSAVAMTAQAKTHGGGRSSNKLYGWIKRRLVALKQTERKKRRSGRRYNQGDVKKLAAMLARKQVSA